MRCELLSDSVRLTSLFLARNSLFFIASISDIGPISWHSTHAALGQRDNGTHKCIFPSGTSASDCRGISRHQRSELDHVFPIRHALMQRAQSYDRFRSVARYQNTLLCPQPPSRTAWRLLQASPQPQHRMLLYGWKIVCFVISLSGPNLG